MHYAVPRIFEEAGLLERLYTDAYVGNKPWLETSLRTIPQFIRPRIIERWLGRTEPRVPPGKVTSFDLFGLLGSVAYARTGDEKSRGDFFAKHGRAFNRRILACGFGRADTVWGFTGGAAELFRAAKRHGITCIFEQTGCSRAHRELLRSEENARWPGWQPDLDAEQTGRESLRPLFVLEREEIEHADQVIVASDFTRRSLATSGYRTDNVVEVPYGIDHARFFPVANVRSIRPKRLTVLYAGNVELVKGIPYLLQAIGRLDSNNVDVLIAGPTNLSHDLLKPFQNRVRFLGPVPRQRMPDLFRSADLFVLPTLGEGFGVVQIEALASGVPVITTPNCGAVVRDGIDGHIVPIRDADAIAHWLDHYASNPAALAPLRANALERAASYTVEAYGQRLLAAIGAVKSA